MWKNLSWFWEAITLVFVSLILSTLAIPLEHTTGGENDDGLRLGLKYLGDVRGKSYFVEEHFEKNWTSAVTYCRSADLKMATVDTWMQADFLSGKLFPDYGRTYFWIDSYMSPLPLEALGKGRKQTLGRVISNPPLYCNFVYARGPIGLEFTNGHCDWNRFRVLCES